LQSVHEAEHNARNWLETAVILQPGSDYSTREMKRSAHVYSVSLYWSRLSVDV